MTALDESVSARSVAAPPSNPVRDSRLLGLLFGGLLLGSVALAVVRHGTVRPWLAVLGVVLVVLAVVAPRVLVPVTLIWIRIGTLLQAVVSPIFLGVIYFLGFGGTAAIRKLFGVAASSTIDPTLPSYWIRRSDTDVGREELSRPY